MTRPYSRSKPQGHAHRSKIRRWIVPRLHVGCRIPSGAWLAKFLGISASEGMRHMRRVLIEDGIVTELRGGGPAQRRYVVGMP